MSSTRVMMILGVVASATFACVGGPGPLPTEGIGQGGSAGTGQQGEDESGQGSGSGSGDTTCQPGSTSTCTCGDLSGLRQCSSDGRSFTSCVCQVTRDASVTPVDPLPPELDAG
jgi:hypothetical protein